MAEQSKANGGDGVEAQELELDFDGGRFTTRDTEDKKQWISSAVRVAERKAKTRDVISVILVGAIVSSFPVYAIALFFLPEMKQEIMTGFTQWLAVIGSLTGAAVGVGALADRKNS